MRALCLLPAVVFAIGFFWFYEWAKVYRKRHDFAPFTQHDDENAAKVWLFCVVALLILGILIGLPS